MKDVTLYPLGDFSREALGEQKLIEALLMRSILDLHAPERLIREAAADWIWDSDDELGATAFTFEWCCYEVGLEPEPLRRALRAKLAA